MRQALPANKTGKHVASSGIETMGNCIPKNSSQSTSLASLDLEALMATYMENHTVDDNKEYYAGDGGGISSVEPCHFTYCLTLGSSIAPLLAAASILALISNAVLGLTLARCPRPWAHARPGKLELSLTVAASTLFAATLPFFATASAHGWIYGDRFCQAARALKYGGLFAQGLVAAGAMGRAAGKVLPFGLFAVGFVCAVPAALSSTTGDVCVPSPRPELLPWSLVHAIACLAVLDVLPAGMLLSKAALDWQGKDRRLQGNITCLFYLFWAPYGVAQLLEKLLQEEVLAATCSFQEHLDYFLGVSEGIGVLQSFLCPLLILGFSFRSQKALSGTGHW